MRPAKITVQAAEDLEFLAEWVADGIAEHGGPGAAYGDVGTFQAVPDCGHDFMVTAGVYRLDGRKWAGYTGLGDTLAGAVADLRRKVERAAGDSVSSEPSAVAA